MGANHRVFYDPTSKRVTAVQYSPDGNFKGMAPPLEATGLPSISVDILSKGSPFSEYPPGCFVVESGVLMFDPKMKAQYDTELAESNARALAAKKFSSMTWEEFSALGDSQKIKMLFDVLKAEVNK